MLTLNRQLHDRRLPTFLSATLAMLTGIAMALTATHAAAQDDVFTPGILYALGEKFDRSFNESAYNALEAFEAETGLSYLEFQPQAIGEFEQGIDAMASRGADHIIVVGFYYAQPLATIAPDYPDVRFTLIDSVAEADNVQSVLFREHEGSFLTGIMAAMASETGTVGFVAAMDIPLLRKFITGFEAGAMYADPETATMVSFVGNTPAAFNDPSRGVELTISQIEQGADVVFAGAGATNFGIFQAAVDNDVLAIGVDSNQNYLHPGSILTSMLKRVDVAVERALEDSLADLWSPGVLTLGLAEDGVGVALDENNAGLVTEAMLAAIDTARADIIAGTLVVPDGQ